MDDNSQPSVGEHRNAIPVPSIQTHLARIVFGVLVVMIILLKLSRSPTVEAVPQGEAIVYTSDRAFDGFTFIFALVAAVLTFFYARQTGIFRIFAIALFAITIWLAFIALTLDTGNHQVVVTPSGVTREVGTRSDPIRHHIDFTTTAYLVVEEVPGTRGPIYELVAIDASDGHETRIPIFDLMRAALPQIIDRAIANNVVVGDSVDGFAIPAALRVESGE